VIRHGLAKRTARRLVNGAALLCEGGGGRRPRRMVLVWLQLSSSMALAALGDDGDRCWDQRLVMVGRGGVARSDSGGDAHDFGPLGGSQPRPQAAFIVGARVWQLREAASWRAVSTRLQRPDMDAPAEENGQ
jgi:hypothetical protein